MLDISNLSVQAGKFTLSKISLTVEEGDCCILLGKSGAGKTVFLEALAGRYPIKEGRIVWNGTDITFLPPEKRQLSLVYQDYALFPRMTVAENIAFPLKSAGKKKKFYRERTEMMLESFSLVRVAKQYPETLSGGEQQRTALARALITEPKLLLLDEPMSALDCVTREKVTKLLHDLHKSCKTTIIQVTHDFEEARAFADVFAVIQNRTLSQKCTKDKLLSMRKEDVYALLDQ
jgi:ABC-type Fe3+/spermidine/putrescine transport system ATPase subunit